MNKCNHVLDYEKKSNRMTWLRCIYCHEVVGWLEDTSEKVEGKVVELSEEEREELA